MNKMGHLKLRREELINASSKLNSDTRRDLALTRAEIRAGKFKTLEQVKKNT